MTETVGGSRVVLNLDQARTFFDLVFGHVKAGEIEKYGDLFVQLYEQCRESRLGLDATFAKEYEVRPYLMLWAPILAKRVQTRINRDTRGKPWMDGESIELFFEPDNEFMKLRRFLRTYRINADEVGLSEQLKWWTKYRRDAFEYMRRNRSALSLQGTDEYDRIDYPEYFANEANVA